MGWIDVNKALPEFDKKVLLSYKYSSDDTQRSFIIGILNAKMESSLGIDFDFHDDDSDRIYGVTHWMPLPEPPKNA